MPVTATLRLDKMMYFVSTKQLYLRHEKMCVLIENTRAVTQVKISK